MRRSSELEMTDLWLLQREESDELRSDQKKLEAAQGQSEGNIEERYGYAKTS